MLEEQVRLERIVSSGDCERIYGLNPPGRPELDTPSRCESLQRLAGLDPVGAERFGRAGAVFEYRQGQRIISAVAVFDEEGQPRLAFIDPFLGERSVGTSLNKRFEPAAKRVLNAMRSRECGALLAVAYRRLGPGSGPADEACARLASHPLAGLLAVDPTAKLALAGGNNSYAFFKLVADEQKLTVVMARQEPAPELPDDAGDLPRGAARYALVDAYG